MGRTTGIRGTVHKSLATALLIAGSITGFVRSARAGTDDSAAAAPEASGSVSQPASIASKQAQQVEQDPTAVKKRSKQPAEKSPMDSSTIALDDNQAAVSSSSPESSGP